MKLTQFVLPLRVTGALLVIVLGAYACSTEGAPEPALESTAASPASTSPSDALLARSELPYVVPYEVSLRSEEEQAAYVRGLTDEQFAELVENARILAFLRLHLDDARLEQLGSVVPELGVLTPSNVEPYLSAEELTQLAAFKYDGEGAASSEPGADVISKSCSSWRYTRTFTQSCNILLYICVDCDHYVRSCDWWEVFASESQDRCRVVRYHD